MTQQKPQGAATFRQAKLDTSACGDGLSGVSLSLQLGRDLRLGLSGFIEAFFVSDEEKKDRRVGAKGYRIPDERKAAARVLYETVPGLTQDQVAEDIGVSARSIQEWVRKEGWTKAPILPPTGVTEKAQEVADKYKAKLSDFGPEVTPEQKHQALQETAVETAVTYRAQLLDRHRREWSGPRTLIYEAMKTKNFELCKVAKISAEALQIIQQNERKAWGIDPVNPDAPSTILIERE